MLETYTRTHKHKHIESFSDALSVGFRRLFPISIQWREMSYAIFDSRWISREMIFD